VFVDVDEGIVMDVSQVEAAITPRTRAILPVHWTGSMADMLRLAEIAQRHGLPIVEDACHAIGATLDGAAAGSLGDIGGFSFPPVKHINAWGDGGILVTRSAELDANVRIARNYGLVDRDEAETFARNSRLHALQVPVLRRQLEVFEDVVARRNEIAARY